MGNLRWPLWINRGSIAEQRWNLDRFWNNPVGKIDELGKGITSNDCVRSAGKVKEIHRRYHPVYSNITKVYNMKALNIPYKYIYCSFARVCFLQAVVLI